MLGGGGSAGNAWLIGVAAGLAESGVDVTEADLIVGTSAGSTAAAQILCAPPGELLAAILDAPSARSPAAGGPVAGTPAGGRGARRPISALEATDSLIATSADIADMRHRIGEWAIAQAVDDVGASPRWRAMVKPRLPGRDWPSQRLLITAVDAETGEPVIFDRAQGVDLVDAVAASCSSGVAYSFGGRHYIDGGYRSNADNADLAAGHARILVLSPFGGRSRTPAEWGTHLSTQIDVLREQGSTVELIVPDTDSLAAFGDNVMDPRARVPAASAGHRQGLGIADGVARFWALGE